MTPGWVAFLTAAAVLTGFYAWKGNTGRTIARDEYDTTSLRTPHDDSEPVTGLFERIIRPMIRNILPQTPMAAQVKARNSTKIAELLVKSGNPWNIQPEEFLALRILAFIVGAGLAGWLCLVGAMPPLLPKIGWVLIGSIIGAFVPNVLLDGAKGRRLKEARRTLPEAVDLLTITLESGKRLDTAIAEVQLQLPEGVIREELARVVSDLNTGRDLTGALTDFARRAPSFEVESFARSIITAEKMGSDATDTLKRQAIQARSDYEQMLDAKIGKLPTTLFFPILLLMVPALFIVILAPSITNIGAAFQ